jgi:hypothetical protein
MQSGPPLLLAAISFPAGYKQDGSVCLLVASLLFRLCYLFSVLHFTILRVSCTAHVPNFCIGP